MVGFRRQDAARFRDVAKSDGWGARIRTWEWRNQNPLPYHLATPQQARGTIQMGAAPINVETSENCYETFGILAPHGDAGHTLEHAIRSIVAAHWPAAGRNGKESATQNPPAG